jgi:hypothetical protein
MATTDPEEPRGAEDVDREIRINELKCRAEELAGGEMTTFEADEAPPEILEEFWESVVGYESAPDTSEHERLRAEGIELPAPDQLDDAALTKKLWEVIHALAARNTFLTNTDHLSDRELYTFLINECFHEISKDVPKGTGWVHGIDILGSYGEKEIELHHRYYADHESRARWLERFPNDVLPPREKPPYDRDRLLPKAPF